MQKIELFSYFNTFPSTSKIRPGFRTKEGVLWVLTHTVPKKKYFKIPKTDVHSPHFVCRGEYVYLTTADNQQAHRYNNVPGGYLFTSITFSPMKVFLYCTDENLAKITREMLGLSEQANVEEVKGCLQRQANGVPPTDLDEGYMALESWQSVAEKFRAEVAKLVLAEFPILGTPIAITTDELAATVQSMPEAIGLLQADPKDEAGLMVLTELGVTFDEATVTPASEEDLQSLLVAEGDVTPTDVDATSETSSADATAAPTPDATPDADPASTHLPAVPEATGNSMPVTRAALKRTLASHRETLEKVKKMGDIAREVTDATMSSVLEIADALVNEVPGLEAGE
jgi:hypothetical protein